MTPQHTEVISAKGHPNIQSIHPTTLMFTKDVHLSKNGDCIVAIAADKAAADLSPEFKAALQKPNAKLTITIRADDLEEQIHAFGSPRLTLAHPTDLVIRRSDYVCSRTLAVCADKASNNLSREFVEMLKDPDAKVEIHLSVTVDR